MRSLRIHQPLVLRRVPHARQVLFDPDKAVQLGDGGVRGRAALDGIVWQRQPQVEELTSEDTDIFEARVRARRTANPVQQFPRRRSSRQRRSSFRVDV